MQAAGVHSAEKRLPVRTGSTPILPTKNIARREVETSLITRLFEEGQYGFILRKIFSYLDGTSLRCCELVNRTWNNFIITEVWGNPKNKKWLWQGWKEGVPTSRRLEIYSPSKPRNNLCIELECMAMKADELGIVVGLSDGRVDVYSRATMAKILVLHGHTDVITSLALDSRLIVSGGNDEKVTIWCRKTGKSLAVLKNYSGMVSACHLDSPLDQGSGLVRQHLYTCCRNGNVYRYGLLLTTQSGCNSLQFVRDPVAEDFKLLHDEMCSSMAVGSDHILVGTVDGRIFLWDKRSGIRQKILNRHKSGVKSLHIRYPLAMSGSKDKTAVLWDLERGVALKELQHALEVRTVFFNNRIIITTDDFKDIYLWDINKPTSPKETCMRALTGHNGPVHGLHCEKGVLISCDLTGVVIEKDFWRCVEEGAGMRILRCTDGVNCMVCDSSQVVVGLLNKTIEVYDRKTLALIRTLSGHGDHVWSLDMNQEYIVSGSWDSSVRIWSRTDGVLLFVYTHPHGREISGVKISGNKILVTSLAGSLNVIERASRFSFVIKKFFPGSQDLGEIYSLACDSNYVITGHTLANSSFKLWKSEDFSVVKVIKEECNESIIWNIHLEYPLALICRDNEVLDIYNLEKGECVKNLRHESKVLCAKVFDGKIIVGCQYGLMVIWDIGHIMQSEKKSLSISHCQLVVYEHSASISNIHADHQEIITDDYDGIVILRNVRTYKKIQKIFRRSAPV